MSTCAEKQARLAKLEAAYDALLTGNNVQMIRSSERQVQAFPIDMNALQRELATLRDQVAACTGDTSRSPRRVIGIIQA